MISRLQTRVAVAYTTISLVYSLASHAQAVPATAISGSQLIARRTLLERAQAASRARDFAQALTLAQQAAAIEMTPSLRMFLAQQQQALGHHADAMESAEYCVRDATRNTALERRDIILGECRRLSAVSQRQVVLVTVVVPALHHTSLSIRVGSRELLAAEYNIPVVFDAGQYEVNATAPGQSNHTEVAIGAPGTTLSVILPSRFALTEAQVAASTTAVVSTGPTVGNGTVNSAVTHTNTHDAVDPHWVGQRPLVPSTPGLMARVGGGPWVLVGTGAAAFLASGVFFGLRNGQFTTCRPVGDAIMCDTAELATQWANGTSTSDPYT